MAASGLPPNSQDLGYSVGVLHHVPDTARLLIRRLPPRPKQLVTDLIALTVYWPLSRLASLAEAAGLPVASFPLSYYRNCSFYTLRTDARDRFGTPLERRFSRAQIRAMCTAAGLVDLRFSSREPYWCVVGFKAQGSPADSDAPLSTGVL